MLRKGDTAPGFELPDSHGNTRTLDEFTSSGDVIVYFYPADFTPGCTAQACAMRDLGGDLDTAGVQIVGISPQDGGSHERFTERFELNFPLLADPKKAAIKAWGVDGPLGFGVRRVTYWVGADGLIKDRVVADVFIGSHTDFIKQMIERTAG